MRGNIHRSPCPRETSVLKSTTEGTAEDFQTEGKHQLIAIIPNVPVIPPAILLFCLNCSIFDAEPVFFAYNTHSASIPNSVFFGINGTPRHYLPIKGKESEYRRQESEEEQQRQVCTQSLLTPHSSLLPAPRNRNTLCLDSNSTSDFFPALTTSNSSIS